MGSVKETRPLLGVYDHDRLGTPINMTALIRSLLCSIPPFRCCLVSPPRLSYPCTMLAGGLDSTYQVASLDKVRLGPSSSSTANCRVKKQVSVRSLHRIPFCLD